MKARILLPILILTLSTLVFFMTPLSESIGFEDDTHEPCLGPNDPYCSGGGAAQSTCWECWWHWSSATDPVACRKNLGGVERCTLTYESYLSEGQIMTTITCDESGGGC